jgi:hypothetical protein
MAALSIGIHHWLNETTRQRAKCTSRSETARRTGLDGGDEGEDGPEGGSRQLAREIYGRM